MTFIDDALTFIDDALTFIDDPLTGIDDPLTCIDDTLTCIDAAQIDINRTSAAVEREWVPQRWREEIQRPLKFSRPFRLKSGPRPTLNLT